MSTRDSMKVTVDEDGKLQIELLLGESQPEDESITIFWFHSRPTRPEDPNPGVEAIPRVDATQHVFSKTVYFEPGLIKIKYGTHIAELEITR
jgi:hypothetical protein